MQHENGPLSEADGRSSKPRCMRWWNDWRQSGTRRKPTPCWNRKPPHPLRQLRNGAAAPAGHGRNGASAFTGGKSLRTRTPTQTGDPCPECREGRVYRQKEPKTLIRIVGQAPLKATVFEMERLRCNGCGQVFTAGAEPPSEPDKYDTTAVAMIALLKYGTGVPFNRMERLEDTTGDSIAGATQWELMEAAAKQLKPMLGELSSGAQRAVDERAA
jgi:transposase